jgi:hypothetical protein
MRSRNWVDLIRFRLDTTAVIAGLLPLRFLENRFGIIFSALWHRSCSWLYNEGLVKSILRAGA